MTIGVHDDQQIHFGILQLLFTKHTRAVWVLLSDRALIVDFEFRHSLIYITFHHSILIQWSSVHLSPSSSLPSLWCENGVDSVQVSWTPPSGEPTVTDYIIYYQQQDGGHNGSVMAGATATTATITGLMTGATYSITMVATSSTLPSTVTAAETIAIGMIW